MINSNQELVNFLVYEGELNSQSLKTALLKIDRRFFVSPKLQNEAYENYPLPIGEWQTISQPSTVVFMLEKLQPQLGQNILEVGSGCGWVSALLAFIVGNKGRVTGIDIIPELVELARDNTKRFNFNNLEFIAGDGSKGFIKLAPYERIIVSAGAKTIPQALIEQLKDGGRMVIPVGDYLQDMMVVEKKGKWIKKVAYPGFVFVPLLEDRFVS